MIGFNYPNSNYLRGGYGVRTAQPQLLSQRWLWTARVLWSRLCRRPGRAGCRRPAGIGTAGAIAAAPFANSYAYYGDRPGYW